MGSDTESLGFLLVKKKKKRKVIKKKKSGTELIDSRIGALGEILKPTTSHTSRTHARTHSSPLAWICSKLHRCIADASGAGRLSEYMFKKEDLTKTFADKLSQQVSCCPWTLLPLPQLSFISLLCSPLKTNPLSSETTTLSSRLHSRYATCLPNTSPGCAKLARLKVVPTSLLSHFVSLALVPLPWHGLRCLNSPSGWDSDGGLLQPRSGLNVWDHLVLSGQRCKTGT